MRRVSVSVLFSVVFFFSLLAAVAIVAAIVISVARPSRRFCFLEGSREGLMDAVEEAGADGEFYTRERAHAIRDQVNQLGASGSIGADDYFTEMPRDSFRREILGDIGRSIDEADGEGSTRTHPVSQGRLPLHWLRDVIGREYLLRVNRGLRRYETEKEKESGSEPFETALFHVERGYLLLPDDATRANKTSFAYRVRATVCVHRSGKSVGLCARLVADVDPETREVTFRSADYVGDLPEFHAVSRVAPRAHDTSLVSLMHVT